MSEFAADGISARNRCNPGASSIAVDLSVSVDRPDIAGHRGVGRVREGWLRGLAAAYTDLSVHRGGMTRRAFASRSIIPVSAGAASTVEARIRAQRPLAEPEAGWRIQTSLPEWTEPLPVLQIGARRRASVLYLRMSPRQSRTVPGCGGTVPIYAPKQISNVGEIVVISITAVLRFQIIGNGSSAAWVSRLQSSKCLKSNCRRDCCLLLKPSTRFTQRIRDVYQFRRVMLWPFALVVQGA